MTLTKKHIEYIKAAPVNQPYTGVWMNQILKWKGWDNLTHKAWEQWAIEQDLIKLNILKKLSGGRGRGNLNTFIMEI